MSITAAAVDLAAEGQAATALEKSLKRRHVEMIAIGGIIGAGLFVGSSSAIATAGPAAIVSYGLAGLIVLLVMRMLSEMAIAIPGVQAFPDFARLGLGHWAGFLSGWLYWYFWVVVVAIEAIAGATIVHQWLPMLPTWAIGIILTAVLTLVNLMSTRSYGEFEFWFSAIKVAAILAFIVATASFVLGLTGVEGAGLSHLTVHGGFMPNGLGPVLAGVTAVIFSLVGAEIATIAAAESTEAATTLGRMTASVALRILIFYIASIALIVAVLPWTAIVPGESPFAAVLAAMGIPGGALAMNMLVLVAVLSCLNSGLYVTSRVLFSLASHGDAPQWLVRVDRRRVPVRAILVASLFAYVALVASILSPGMVFAFLVNASGALMLVIYLMIATAQLRLRRRIEAEDSERLTVRMWLHPWGTLAAMAGMVAVLVAMAATPGLASQFYASLVPVAVALVFWRVRAHSLSKA